MIRILNATIKTIDEKNHVRFFNERQVEIKIIGEKKPEPKRESKTEKIVEKITKKKTKK